MSVVGIATAASGTANVLSKYGKYLVVAGILFLLYQWLWPLIRRIFGNIPDDAPYFIGGGDVLTGFYDSRQNITGQLYKVLKRSSFGNEGRCEMLMQAAGWNDNQLIMIHNAFKNRYGVTLYDMLAEVNGDDCGLLDFGYYDVQVKDRLSTLGLV